jgi:hypothetical protein
VELPTNAADIAVERQLWKKVHNEKFGAQQLVKASDTTQLDKLYNVNIAFYCLSQWYFEYFVCSI